MLVVWLWVGYGVSSPAAASLPRCLAVCHFAVSLPRIYVVESESSMPSHPWLWLVWSRARRVRKLPGARGRSERQTRRRPRPARMLPTQHSSGWHPP